MYYADKIDSLRDLFESRNVLVEEHQLIVDQKKIPIVDDVIILIDSNQFTPYLKKKSAKGALFQTSIKSEGKPFAEDIQFTFGEEWKKYDQILPEHEDEFKKYFDLVDLDSLSQSRICDLGCGIGRWSYFLKNKCKELILIDFSDAIFVARKNLADFQNCLFFMCDLKKIPFRNDFSDLLFCLGVLHHLPTPCLDEVKNLRKYSPKLLIFLYYALDNRPFYFRWILKVVTFFRLLFSHIRSHGVRQFITKLGVYFVYFPLILLGKALRPLGGAKFVPLYDFYHNKTLKRIEQDVYDRFFTRIEQRVSKKDILKLKDSFLEIKISESFPYHHFLCER